MIIGALTLKIHLPQSQSLKEKRGIIKSIASRLKNQFNVSVSEIDANDLWQLAVLGICCVSNHGYHASQVLDQVMNFVIHNYPELEIASHRVETISVEG